MVIFKLIKFNFLKFRERKQKFFNYLFQAFRNLQQKYFSIFYQKQADISTSKDALKNKIIQHTKGQGEEGALLTAEYRQFPLT